MYFPLVFLIEVDGMALLINSEILGWYGDW
jgi:hypothetical protein